MTTRYAIKFTAEANKRFRQLDKRYQRSAREAIDRLAVYPTHGEPLTGKLTGYWKLRFSRYRLIYRIAHHQLLVIVFDVRHRRDVYR